jgi:hypothetical protein
MPGIGAILRILLQILAGVGVAHAMDKVLPGKAPGYQSVSPGLKPAKLIWFLTAFGGGALLWNFVNRKFHIIARRHAPRRKRSRRR